MSLALALALSLHAAPSCEGLCSATANRCFSQCRGADKCAQHCDSNQNDCLAACAKQDAAQDEKKRAKKVVPCGMTKVERKAQPTPCTEDEKKAMREALTSKEMKRLCKDEEGNLTACKDDAEKAQQLYEKSKPKCTDAYGAPVECQK